MSPDLDLVNRCLKRDPKAQEMFYNRFAPRVFGICLRYAGSRMEAEDILQDGFVRIFTNLHQYRSEGSLEGWVHRTMVNTAINYYRKNLKYRKEIPLDETQEVATITEDALSVLSAEDLITVIQGLPPGYRTVFNLYVMEGLTHKEIGEMTGISENTSKSQLSRARVAIQQRLSHLGHGK